MVIECIFFDGVAGRAEGDEYVQVLNNGKGVVDLAGWEVKDISDGRPGFIFEESFTLEPGRRIRVYTNEVHVEWGGFSYGWGRSVWSNSEPDTAGLLNPAGSIISTRSYPPGCE